MTQHHYTLTDIDTVYAKVRAIREQGHGAAVTVHREIVVLTTRAPKKLLKKIL